MIDLTKFRENADERGICEEYSEKWADCVSKKQLMDLALDINGTIYLCNAIANGWGLSPEFIEDKFAPQGPRSKSRKRCVRFPESNYKT